MQFVFGEVTTYQELQSRVSQSAELSEALSISIDNPEELTHAQKIQVTAWLEEWLSLIATWANLNTRGVLSEDQLEQRMGNECSTYLEHRVLLDELRSKRDYGFPLIDQHCE